MKLYKRDDFHLKIEPQTEKDDYQYETIIVFTADYEYLLSLLGVKQQGFSPWVREQMYKYCRSYPPSIVDRVAWMLKNQIKK